MELLLGSSRRAIAGRICRLLGLILRLLDNVRVLLLGTLRRVFDRADGNGACGRPLHVLSPSVACRSRALLTQTLLVAERGGGVCYAGLEMLHQVCLVSQVACLVN